MANKIKGLTIEIAGETTLLQKSMSEVNTKTRDLKTELRDVERLLKLDPGNTELIAQKQKILADSISATSDKLNQLKEAEKQVQEQFKKGEVSEEQLRQLQREVIKTESELKKLEQTSKGFSDNFSKKLKEAGNSMKDFGGKVESAGNKFAPVSVAAAGLLTGLVANVEVTKEYREEMGKLETAFTTSGHSAEAAKEVYDGFYAVLGEEDRAVEAVSHLAKLTTTQEELSKWTDIATGVYATFGDSLPIEGLTEAANETAKTGELTGVLTDALNWAGISEDDFRAKLEATSSEKERAQLITETLNELYSESAEKYREVNEDIIAANESQGAMNDTMAIFGEVMQPITNDVLKVLADALKDVADWMASLDEETLKIILTIIAAVAVITPLLIIVSKVIVAVGSITTALPILGAAFGAISLPIAGIVVVIGLLIAAGVALYKNWDTVKQKATEIFSAIGKFIGGVFDGVIGTIKNFINWVGTALTKVKEFFGAKSDAENASISGTNTTAGLKGYINGSHANGLDYVPYDGYIAELHRGERVLTAAENRGTSVNHTGTIRVEGVNDKGSVVAVVELVMDQLRREVRMG